MGGETPPALMSLQCGGGRGGLRSNKVIPMAHSSPPAQDSQAAGVVHLPSMCKAGREGGRGK